MTITKYEHSCVVLEEQGSKIVIDPGAFTKSLINFTNIAGVVVTHAHPDHFSLELIMKIQDANPKAVVYTTSTVSQEMVGRLHKTVKDGDREPVTPFFLAFFGGKHAVIRPDYAEQENIGVFVNNLFYYAGDAFVLPKVPVEVLAIPSTAPWLKISEAMDYLTAVKPKIAFPTHNAMLSDIGNNMHNRMIGAVAKQNDIEYRVLHPGQSIEI